MLSVKLLKSIYRSFFLNPVDVSHYKRKSVYIRSRFFSKRLPTKRPKQRCLKKDKEKNIYFKKNIF